jgi:hypothetical protein
MSMINISGIPNMGFAGGGGGYFGGNAALGLPAMGAAGDFGASKFSQPLYDSLYGPQGFGGQTDYYSALGAAYGRATGGFDGSAAGWSGQPMGSTFDTSAYENAVKGLLGGGGGGGYPGGFPGSYFDPSIYQPAQQPVEDVNSWFNQLAGGGGGGNPYPLGGYGGFDPFGGGQQAIPPGFHMDTRFGVPGGMPSSQALLGYDPSFSAQFAPGGGSDFAARFGQWGLNPGQPSQYYTGSAYPWANPMLPPGFAQPYSFDNPGGALPPGPQSRNQSDAANQNYSA